MILGLYAWILLLAAINAAPEDPDPCTSYISLDGVERDYHRDTDSTKTPLCDKDLSPGWYRFTGAEVATTNVGIRRCGTESTVWMNDTLPSTDRVVNRKFCFNHLDVSPTGCLWSEHVPVKNCGGFMIYQFPLKTILCPMAVCTDSFPNITGNPELSAPQTTSDGGFRHACTFTSPNTSRDARFIVTWFVDGVTVSHSILTGKERDAYFDLDQWKGHINKELTCSVRSYYGDSNATTSQEYISNGYFGGIKVDPESVRIVEGVDTIVEVISTLPINCRDQDLETHCHLELTVTAPDVLTVGDCNLTLTPSDWNSTTQETRVPLSLTSRQDLVVKPRQETFLSFEVSPNPKSRLDIWQNASIPQLQVLIEDTEFVSCFGHGDPHFTESFNAGLLGSYNLYHLGDFKFASDARVPIAVQISTHVFSPDDLPVTSAVAVQIGSDVTIIDTDSGSTAPVVTSNRRPESHTIQACGTNEYQISTPSGHRINVFHRYQIPGGHYIDVRATFPSGVVSVDDGNLTTNDVSYEVCNIGPTTEGQTTLGSFAEISSNVIDYFRVRPENNLLKGKTLKMKSVSPRRYCSCQSKTSDESSQCETGLEVSDPYISGTGRFESTTRVVILNSKSPLTNNTRETCRRLTPRVKNKPTNQTEPTRNNITGEYRLITRSWPTASGITEDDARARCLDAIRNYTSPQCANINVNMSNFVDGCADDVQASGGFGYIPAAIQAFQSNCETIFLNNATNFNDTIEDDFGIVKLVNDQCPNLCSLHGACFKGRCQCDAGWEWEDCSVKSGNPSRVIGVRGGVLCDTSIFDDCFNPTVVVENLGRVTGCIVIPVDYDQGTPGAIKESFTVESFRENSFSVSCNMTSVTQREIHARVFNISLVTESDNMDGSEVISYLVYDGVCQKCDDDFTCYQKQDACLIGGRCYHTGDVNVATDFMQVCDPQSDLDGWTDLLHTFPITVGRK